MRRDRHGLIQLAILVASFVGAIVVVYVVGIQAGGEEAAPRLANWSVRSEDGQIAVKWSPQDGSSLQGVRVEVSDDDTPVYIDTIEGQRRSTTFENGVHGRLYSVRLTPLGANGAEGEQVGKDVLFLQYDQLPDLPLMTINTASGDDPTFDEYDAPTDDLWGATITNNELLDGELLLSSAGENDFTSEVDLRVRGNTSNLASGTGKYGYLLELESPYALPGYERQAYKEWALLNVGDSIRTYVGDWIGDQCGMEWQPHMMFVNLMLNGDWKGTYCLTPSVSAQNSNDLVSKTGYIFEADSYWWAQDDIYFRTENQVPQVAYTFKYPKMKGADDKHITRLRDYMQQFEDRLFADDPSYRDYIDEASFASWMLARDISGNIDAGGTNVYYYKHDFDTANPTSSKVKMGPLWDHDTIFLSWDGWSYSHSGAMTYFDELFEQPSFVSEYQRQWEAMGSTLKASAEVMLEELAETRAGALDASWALERERWGTSIPSFDEQRNTASLWFEARIPWMYNALDLVQPASISLDASTYERIEGRVIAGMESSESQGGSKVMRGFAFLDDTSDMTHYTIPGVLVDDSVYLANSESRPDIQATYGLESDEVGFHACLPADVEGQPCVVDIQNHVLYL